MPKIILHSPAKPYLTHNNVVVYQCYLDDMLDDPVPFVFTTNPLGTDSTHPDAFDIRVLDKLPAVAWMRAYPAQASEKIAEALMQAIEAGLIPVHH